MFHLQWKITCSEEELCFFVAFKWKGKDRVYMICMFFGAMNSLGIINHGFHQYNEGKLFVTN